MVLIRKKFFRVAAILSIAILLLTSCGNQSVDIEEGKQEAPPVVKIEVSDWGWDPSAITVKNGKSVTFEITNTGRMPHGIWIPKLGVNEGVSSGKVIQVTINTQTTGKYIIRCSDPMCGNAEQHADMNATLFITE